MTDTRADFTGYSVESRGESIAGAVGPLLVDVHRVFAHFGEHSDRVLSVGEWRPVRGTPVFIHDDFVSGLVASSTQGTWSALLVPTADRIDSYLIVGAEPGLTSAGSAAADSAWGAAALAQAQPPFEGRFSPGVGWVSQALPSNPAPNPDSSGRVFVAQLVVPSGTSALFRARISWSSTAFSTPRESSTTFAIGPTLDECLRDPAKLLPLLCGCGFTESDTDLDGVADCVDRPASRRARLAWEPDEAAYPRFVGQSMSLDGDRVALGAPETNVPGGLVGGFALARREDGAWRPGRFTPAPNELASSEFGARVALSGGSAAVSARDALGRGLVAVMRETRDGAWSFAQALSAPDLGDSSEFGAAILLREKSGVFVGAPGSGFSSFPGVVREFAFDGDGLYSVVATIAEPTGRSARCGAALAQDGDALVIGAPSSRAAGSEFGGGAAFVFRRSNAGAWQLEAELRAASEYGAQDFGASVAMHGDTVLVGAPRGRTVDGGEAIGTASVFVRDASGSWLRAATLSPDDLLDPTIDPPAARFGATVAVRDGRALVGAPNRSYGTPLPVGNAYLFERAPSGAWPLALALADRDPDTETFATSVALHASGEMLVGSPRTGPGISYFGAFNVFADGAIPGDVNGDGIVNAADLTALLLAWGSTGGPADLDGDGLVDAQDLAKLLASWS